MGEITVVCRIERPDECRIIERVNKFVVTVERNGRKYRAYLNNTGRLADFLVSGRKAFCLPMHGQRKTDLRLFAIADRALGAIIDTRLQMELFERAAERGLIPWLLGFQIEKRNVKLGTARIDYLLRGRSGEVLLEVKSAVLREGEYALYPDCPSARGRKHLQELTEYVSAGGEAVVLFIAALPDVQAFKPNRAADPKLSTDLQGAQTAGVEMRAIGLYYNPDDRGVYLYNPDLPIRLL